MLRDSLVQNRNRKELSRNFRNMRDDQTDFNTQTNIDQKKKQVKIFSGSGKYLEKDFKANYEQSKILRVMLYPSVIKKGRETLRPI